MKEMNDLVNETAENSKRFAQRLENTMMEYVAEVTGKSDVLNENNNRHMMVGVCLFAGSLLGRLIMPWEEKHGRGREDMIDYAVDFIKNHIYKSIKKEEQRENENE